METYRYMFETQLSRTLIKQELFDGKISARKIGKIVILNTAIRPGTIGKLPYPSGRKTLYSSSFLQHQVQSKHWAGSLSANRGTLA